MKKFEVDCFIHCRTQEEQEMVLDIFEMLGYIWHAGQAPRRFRSHTPSMYYHIHNECYGYFTHAKNITYGCTVIEAKNLRNMWISLKRRKS